MIMLQGEI